MIKEIDELIEHMKSLAERLDSIGDMSDVDMGIMYLRHLKKRIENREESK